MGGGAVAQLVAHLHGMEGVRGSSPLSSTIKMQFRRCLARLEKGASSASRQELEQSGDARSSNEHRGCGRSWSRSLVAISYTGRVAAGARQRKRPFPVPGLSAIAACPDEAMGTTASHHGGWPRCQDCRQLGRVLRRVRFGSGGVGVRGRELLVGDET